MSIQQQLNSSKQSSFNIRTSKPLETDGRSCVEPTRPPENWCNFGQRICCNNVFLVHSGKGRGIETQTLFIRWKTEKISRKTLDRKVDSAVRGERMAQRTLNEAEAEVEARNCEKRNFWLCLSGDQSRIWMLAISTTPSKSMGRSGSKRQDYRVFAVDLIFFATRVHGIVIFIPMTQWTQNSHIKHLWTIVRFFREVERSSELNVKKSHIQFNGICVPKISKSVQQNFVKWVVPSTFLNHATSNFPSHGIRYCAVCSCRSF